MLKGCHTLADFNAKKPVEKKLILIWLDFIIQYSFKMSLRRQKTIHHSHYIMTLLV